MQELDEMIALPGTIAEQCADFGQGFVLELTALGTRGVASPGAALGDVKHG